MSFQLRDGSSAVSTAGQRSQHGVPPIRKATGKLPGGACIPPILENWKHKILLAGKYVNVMRECGVVIEEPASEQSNGDENVWQVDNEKCGASLFRQS